MHKQQHIEVELAKLANGERLLRLADPDSGLSLEKKLDHKRPVIAQRRFLLNVFEEVLTQLHPIRPG